MSITSYLRDDFDVDPETRRVLGVALEKTRVSLGLADDFADGILAKRLIELAKAGKHNPDLLCQGAIQQLRGHLYGGLTGRSYKRPGPPLSSSAGRDLPQRDNRPVGAL